MEKKSHDVFDHFFEFFLSKNQGIQIFTFFLDVFCRFLNF